ncbi:MAG: 30S ribosomal protein S9 [Chloroflexus aggregans]|uniref:30S ribosomal protein S9 n=1 Tax=Chloroflexus aggregans TaxID=152260 RepID=A0A2J6XF21_9CHLR|nr:MAG: 30S ribosomal protein S9 [Chloroflexus aggregans]
MEGKRYYQGTGVRLFPGRGDMIVNGKKPEDYFGKRDLFQHELQMPLVLTNHLNTFNVLVKVKGGGVSGQVGAVRHGIARALLDYDSGLRPVLKQAGLLTRDPRAKERKKAGLKRARKAPQYTKR